MKPQEIKNLVNEGVQLSTRLDEIKGIFTAQADGKKASFEGDNGNKVTVSPTAPSLKRLETEEDVDKARKICGDKFDTLFAQVHAPVKAFRDLVKVALKPAAGVKLLTMLFKSKGSTRIDFKAGAPTLA